MPPLAERQHHRLLHLPYRSWCKHCISGRGREDAHKRQENRERLVPRVWLDYTFANMGTEVLTILCLKDETSGAVESIAVPEKGAADYAVKAAVRAIEAWGLKRVTLVADGEAAIQALLTAIKLHREKETVVTGKPRYDSKSKGVVENANMLAKGLLRTWVSSLEAHYKVELESHHAVVEWAVWHCGWSLTRNTALRTTA